jgi:hypothetical protein
MSGENGSWLHVNSNTAAGGAAINAGPDARGAVLKRVVINTVGAAANQLTLYDATSTQGTAGKVIAVVSTTNAAIPSLDYNIVASSGLWYTLLTGTAADLTIVFQ